MAQLKLPQHYIFMHNEIPISKQVIGEFQSILLIRTDLKGFLVLKHLHGLHPESKYSCLLSGALDLLTRLLTSFSLHFRKELLCALKHPALVRTTIKAPRDISRNDGIMKSKT